MNKTKIEWCGYTWNPVTGCLHRCEYCYARNQARRFAGCYDPSSGENIKQNETGVIRLEHTGHLFFKTKKGKIIRAPYPYGFAPTFHRYRLNEPQKLKKPSNIFVCSMADLFGDWVPDGWIQEVFKACESAPWHRYLFLTKNPGRYGILNGQDHKYDWEWVKQDWWFGITVTDTFDLPIKLQQLPYGKANTFLSIEPLLEPIDLSFYFPKPTTRWKCSFCGYLTDTYSSHCAHCGKKGGYSGSFRAKPINWVIIGAETGNRKGKVIPKREWIENIAEQCRAFGVPVFMKNNLREVWGEELIQEFPWSENYE